MQASSLLLRSGELLITVAAMYDDGVLASLLDEAVVHELRHQVCCECSSLDVLLQLHDLLLESLDLDVLLRRVQLLLQLCLLVGPDLRHGAAPFAGGLQHVGRDALGD